MVVHGVWTPQLLLLLVCSVEPKDHKRAKAAALHDTGQPGGIPQDRIIQPPHLQVSSYLGLSASQVDAAYDGLYEKNRLWARQRWMGVQCQQDPTDAWILQELLFDTQPDLLIETGTQNGGGTLFYASLMRLYNPRARVLTIDVQPPHAAKPSYFLPGFCERVGCRNATANPLWEQHVEYVQGKSTDAAVLATVRCAAQG